MNLENQMKANSLLDNDIMMDDFISIKISKQKELQEKRKVGVYDGKLRREIKTVSQNISRND